MATTPTVILNKRVNLTKNTRGEHFVGSRDVNRRFVADNPRKDA